MSVLTMQYFVTGRISEAEPQHWSQNNWAWLTESKVISVAIHVQRLASEDIWRSCKKGLTNSKQKCHFMTHGKRSLVCQQSSSSHTSFFCIFWRIPLYLHPGIFSYQFLFLCWTFLPLSILPHLPYPTWVLLASRFMSSKTQFLSCDEEIGSLT